MKTTLERTREYRDYIDLQYQQKLQLYQQKVNKAMDYYDYYGGKQNYYYHLPQLAYFKYNKNNFYLSYYRRYLAAYKIQQFWKKILYNPHHRIGKKYINLQYDKLFT